MADALASAGIGRLQGEATFELRSKSAEVRHLGGDAAGRKHRHGHILAMQLFYQALPEVRDERLGRAVSRLVGRGLQASHAGDEHECARLLLRQKVRHEQVREPHHAGQVGGHQRLVGAPLELLVRPEVGDTGVENHRVHPHRARALVEHALDILGLGEVGRDHAYGHTVFRLELAAQLFEPVLAPRHQDGMGAVVASKLTRKLPAET